MVDVTGSTKIVYKDSEYFYDTGTAEGAWDGDDQKVVNTEILAAIKKMEEAGVEGSFAGHELGEILASIDNMSEATLTGDNDKEKISELLKKIKDVTDQLSKVNDKLKAGGLSTEDKQALKLIQSQLQKEAKQLFNRAKDNYNPAANGFKGTFKDLKGQLKNLGVNVSYEPDGSKSSSSSGGGAKAAHNPNAQQGGGAKGAAWGPQPGFNMGWQTGGPGGGFNFNAYANSMYTDSAILEGFDQVGKNAANQKKMMMMFFYFAQQAMSGDMGAMYRFMQFITYIISKDKAMQNIHMASKLIEMENSSRAALEELLKQPTPDGQDQAASFEFTKVMERTKAHQSSIAMSQKLIAQMMEEMSQVVESLTGSTKAALDANGRILQRLTRG